MITKGVELAQNSGTTLINIGLKFLTKEVGVSTMEPLLMHGRIIGWVT